MTVSQQDIHNEYLVEQIVKVIKTGDVELTRQVCDKLGNPVNIWYQENSMIYFYPVCWAAIQTGKLSMIKLILEGGDFDPEVDGLRMAAILTCDLDIIEFVLSQVPTVEKEDEFAVAESTQSPAVIELVSHFVGGWNRTYVDEIKSELVPEME